MNLSMEDEKILPNRTEDSIVKSLIQKFWDRSSRGVEEYGTTLEQNKLSIMKWVRHLQEELMDASLYLEKINSIYHKSTPQIEGIKKDVIDQQNSLAVVKRSLEDLMEVSSVSDLQPEFVDLLKSTKSNVENAIWQLETIHSMASSQYMRILKNKDE